MLSDSAHPKVHTFVFYFCDSGLARWWIDDSGCLREGTMLPLSESELELIFPSLSTTVLLLSPT